MTQIIAEIVYNYTPAMCTQFQGIGETFTHNIVGVNGCIEIEEHPAKGEGDKWYYDIHFENGTVVRTFNPNRVIFKNI
jgi:hypothetical protein